MGKRERENPCGICGHYHKYEEGEICGICGHTMPINSSDITNNSNNNNNPVKVGAFPSEILPNFLYLGSYDHTSRAEILKVQGITRILNTVPSCPNLYKSSFTYYSLQDDQSLFSDDAIQYLEQCKLEKERVLVHCMSGKSRSPALVINYLMKSKGWTFEQSYQWVKERRPSVELTPAVCKQLQEYEKSVFGASNAVAAPPAAAAAPAPCFDTSTSSSMGGALNGVPN